MLRSLTEADLRLVQQLDAKDRRCGVSRCSARLVPRLLLPAGALPALTRLSFLDNRGLRAVPASVTELRRLCELSLDRTAVEELPPPGPAQPADADA